MICPSSAAVTLAKVTVAAACCFLLVVGTLVGSADTTITGTPGQAAEICPWEKYNASCPAGSVVLIQHALYGRMELGRCLRTNFGHLGCSMDVQAYLEHLCSGQRTCAVSLPDRVLDTTYRRPCPPDLGAYLELSYTCVQVAEPGDSNCTSGHVLNNLTGYLSSAVSEQTNCSWIISAQPGQTIRLTLLDFGVWRSQKGQSRKLEPGRCNPYAVVTERATDSSITVCGGHEKVSVVYLSKTEQLEVSLTVDEARLEQDFFLIKYEVLGCREPGPYPDAKVTRDGDEATITCQERDRAWKMSCQKNVWTSAPDAPHNCTTPDPNLEYSRFMDNTLSLPQSALIAIILVIAVLIAVIIFTIGIVTLRRHKQNEQSIPLPLDDGEDKFSHQSSYGKEQYPMLAKPERIIGGRESDYATTLQRRLAVPPGAITPSDSDHSFQISSTLSECSTCPIHGPTYNELHNYRQSQMSTFKPHVDHIYESPKFDRPHRSEYREECSTPFYHELEPDAAQMSPTFVPLHHCFVYPDSSS